MGLTEKSGKKEFLYYFTKDFFADVVKETILIENWEEKDFDRRYIEYADIFLKIANECLIKGISDEKVHQYLSQRKKHIVNLFHAKMYEKFKREFIKHGYTEDEADQIMPKVILNGDEIDINTLRNFRDLEEKVFTEKKEKSK